MIRMLSGLAVRIPTLLTFARSETGTHHQPFLSISTHDEQCTSMNHANSRGEPGLRHDAPAERRDPHAAGPGAQWLRRADPSLPHQLRTSPVLSSLFLCPSASA